MGEGGGKSIGSWRWKSKAWIWKGEEGEREGRGGEGEEGEIRRNKEGRER
jgi:hypothetical protein